MHFASINHTNALRILNFALRATDLHLLLRINCSLCIMSSFALARSAARNDPWSLAASHSPIPFINWSTWNSSLHYAMVRNIVATVLTPSKRVLFTSTIYVRLCFIKVIVVAPLSVCFSIIATLRVLSCICAFLVTAIYAFLLPPHPVSIFVFFHVSVQNRRQKVFNRDLCSSAGGFAFVLGRLVIIKLTKTQHIYSVSRFNLEGLRDLLREAKPTKAPPLATGLYLCVPCYSHACLRLLHCMWEWRRYAT